MYSHRMGNRNVPSEEKRQMKNKRRDCNKMSKNTSRTVLPAARGSSGVGNHAFQRGQSNANACFLFPKHPQRVAHCELSWMCSSNVIVLICHAFRLSESGAKVELITR